MIVVDRAITLTQPWATLMAIGAKTIETRSRSTSYRGWFAIHAAKSFPDECRALLNEDIFFADAFDEAEIDRDALPLGVVLAVTRLVDCWTTQDIYRHGLTERESAFGNYAPDRYGYLTRGVRRLIVPLPARGFQAIPWRLPQPITEDMLAAA